MVKFVCAKVSENDTMNKRLNISLFIDVFFSDQYKEIVVLYNIKPAKQDFV